MRSAFPQTASDLFAAFLGMAVRLALLCGATWRTERLGAAKV